ncbi:MAG: Fe-S cluster assembly sulfur transfer protein SufU [Gemmatimonadaceae bacterium]
MTSQLDSLYQEVILDHNRSPRNFRVMADATRAVHGRNPLCGDEVTVWVKMQDDVIEDVSFGGRGCAISKASASMMTGAVKGKTRAEARDIFDRFHALITTRSEAGQQEDLKTLGRLVALGGVRRFPTRVKCASLAWHALRNAVEGGAADVSTDEPAHSSGP